MIPVRNPQCLCFPEDIIIPFALDKRLPDDTLFWIMEEDFRFWPPQNDPDDADAYEQEYTLLRSARSSSEPSESSLPPSRGAYVGPMPPSHPPPPEAYPKSQGQERLSTMNHTALGKGNSKEEMEFKGFSQDVVDLMRIATLCSREGWGNIIWVSWVPKPKKKTFLGHGSALVLVTKDGMQAIKAAMTRKVLQRGHIDLQLQDWLSTGDEAMRARACYLYPPPGSYTEHESTLDPKNYGDGKTRPSGFLKGQKPCHGCRVAGDPFARSKWMFQWNGLGHRREKSFPDDMVLHEPRFDWKSYGEPTALDDDRGRDYNPGKTLGQKRAYRSFQKRMQKRNWVSTIHEAGCEVAFSNLQT